jgi:HAMP domain-containing protein
MAETTDLGMQELFDTAKNIRQKMDAGEPSAPLLQQIMEMVQKCSDSLENMAASHNSLVKSVSRMRGTLERQDHFSQGLLKSIALVARALQTMDLPHASSPTATGSVKKSWLSTAPSRTADPEPAAETPDALVKKGMLLKAAQKLFGARGGRELRYDPDAAARLMMEGKLTRAEQTNWKRFNRLPDHIDGNLAS